MADIFGIKFVAALPHLFVLSVLGWVAGVVAWIGFWIIAFTGKLPEGIHDLTTGVIRWYSRVVGWLWSLTDPYPYPPFSFD